MVGGFSLRISQGSGQHVTTEEHIGIGEQQPVAGCVIGCHPHSMDLSQPTGRQFGNVDHLQPTDGFWCGRNSINYLAGAIRGTIVHHDHFIIVVIEFQQRSKSWPSVLFLIASWNNDADAWIPIRSGWRAVPLRPRNVSYLGHAQSCIQQARKPHQPEDAAGNPMKNVAVKITHLGWPLSAPGSSSIPTGGANRMP